MKKNIFKKPGIIKSIVEDEGDTIVYIEHKTGITGIDISKCRGFIPQKGDEVEVVISLEDGDFVKKRWLK